MQKLTISCLMLIFSLTSIAQIVDTELKFEQTHNNLGTIYSENGPVNIEYHFTNNGDKNFEIRDLEVSCGCTSPTYNNKIYAPGESGDIKVKFDPKGIIGKVDKWIRVKGTFTNALAVELTFDAEIIKQQEDPTKHYRGRYGYLLINKKQFYWGNKRPDAIFYDTLKFGNDGYRNIKITEFSQIPDYITPMNLPMEIDTGEFKDLIFKIDLASIDTIGPVKGYMKMETTDQFFQKKEFSYFCDVSKDYSKLKKRHLKKAPKLVLSNNAIVEMGKMKSGLVRNKKIKISNEGRSPLEIRRIETDCSCTVFKPSKKTLAPGESIEVSVRFDSIFKSGRQSKVITIYSNDPLSPRRQVTVKANVI